METQGKKDVEILKRNEAKGKKRRSGGAKVRKFRGNTGK